MDLKSSEQSALIQKSNLGQFLPGLPVEGKILLCIIEVIAFIFVLIQCTVRGDRGCKLWWGEGGVEKQGQSNLWSACLIFLINFSFPPAPPLAGLFSLRGLAASIKPKSYTSIYRLGYWSCQLDGVGGVRKGRREATPARDLR